MDERVKDAAFDREIESLLAVEPSPEFLARVRARVADETPHRSWVGWHLSVAVASVALGLIVASAIWLSKDGATPTREEARPAVAERVPTQPGAVEPGAVESERIASAPEAESPSPRITHRTARATDVVAAERLVPVVNAEDGKAFDAFLATIRHSGVVLTFNESRDSALAASPLVIDPIAIDPLPDVLEGGVE